MAPRHLRQHLARPHPHLDPQQLASQDAQLPDQPQPPQEEEQSQQQQQQPDCLQQDSHPEEEEEEGEEEDDEEDEDEEEEEEESLSEWPVQFQQQQRPQLVGELQNEKSRQQRQPFQSPQQLEAPGLQRLQSQGTPLENAESSADSAKEPDASGPADSRAAIANLVDVPAYSNGRGSISSLPCDQVEELLRPCLTAAENRATKLLQQTMDTVQSQILRALHQAALDIIEHLGKEAATRVVAAERKAAVLQQELLNVKQQAFSMLLRLKGDTDAQMLEAENKYLFERKRAQESEAKLVAMQDTSKRLKSELRKKGEILEKMQKLVQPDGEYLDKSSRPEETIERRRIGSRSKVNDLHSKAPQPEVENKVLCSMENVRDSRYMKNGCPTALPNGMNMQKTQSAALQPHEGATEQTAEMKLERRWESSTAETSSSAKVGLLGVRSQKCSLSGIREGSSSSLDPQEGHGLLDEIHAAEGSLIHNSQGAKTDHVLVRETGHVKFSPVPSAERDERQVDEVHNTELHKFTPCIEENHKTVAADLQRSSDLCGVRTGKDPDDVGNSVVFEERASSFHRSFFEIDEGTLLKGQGECLLHESLSKSVPNERFGMQIFEAKGDVCEILVGRIQAEGKSEILERVCPNLDLQKNTGEYMINSDKTALRHNSGHLTPTMEPPCTLEPCKKDEQEVCCDCHSKDPESSVCMSEDQELVMSSEFVRPDYEVATSLAELAVTGKEVEKKSPEGLASDVRKQEIDNRPRKLGLRMKRKGAFLEQKDGSTLLTNQRKKPRVAKGQAGLSDGHTERNPRKPRLGNSTSSKDSLAVESSRDSRRLMQGARQLLCLSEKKWR